MSIFGAFICFINITNLFHNELINRSPQHTTWNRLLLNIRTPETFCWLAKSCNLILLMLFSSEKYTYYKGSPNSRVFLRGQRNFRKFLYNIGETAPTSLILKLNTKLFNFGWSVLIFKVSLQFVYERWCNRLSFSLDEPNIASRMGSSLNNTCSLVSGGLLCFQVRPAASVAVLSACSPTFY